MSNQELEKKELEKKVKRIFQKFRPSLPEEELKVLHQMERGMEKMELDGYVVSVLVYDGHGKINCYGQRIDKKIIFGMFNQTMGVQGTRATGQTSYPEPHRLSRFENADYVPAERFGIKDKDAYVALINIPFNPNQEVAHAPRYNLGNPNKT